MTPRPRILELCALRPGWLGDGEGETLEYHCPHMLERIARALESAGLVAFGIYPTPEGDVQFEYDSTMELVVRAPVSRPPVRFESAACGAVRCR